jgi:HlyD family secretion protein
MRRSLRLGIAAGTLSLLVVPWVFRPRDRLEAATAIVTMGPIVRTVVATGTLQPTTTVDVGAQVSGTIESLDVDYNSIVRAGQVVARLDPSELTAQLREARATLGQAEAGADGLRTALTDAQARFTRAQELARAGLISEADFDDAQVTLKAAADDLKQGEAAVAQATAALRTAQVNLDHTIIKSPVDGIVIARNVDVGQTLAAGVQTPVLFTIASDLRHMKLLADVDESDVAELSEGTPASFRVDAYSNAMFSGTVLVVRLQPNVAQTVPATGGGASADSGGSQRAQSAGAATPIGPMVVSYFTVIDVDNPDERLRPGMTATVVLRGAHVDNAVRIPNAALAFRPPDGEGDAPETDSSVWTYDGNRFAPIAVKTGLADDQWTEMVDGPLHPGESLVTGVIVTRTRDVHLW